MGKNILFLKYILIEGLPHYTPLLLAPVEDYRPFGPNKGTLPALHPFTGNCQDFGRKSNSMPRKPDNISDYDLKYIVFYLTI